MWKCEEKAKTNVETKKENTETDGGTNENKNKDYTAIEVHESNESATENTPNGDQVLTTAKAEAKEDIPEVQDMEKIQNCDPAFATKVKLLALATAIVRCNCVL